MNTILDNYRKLFQLSDIKLDKTNSNSHTSKYQVALYLSNAKEFRKVQKKLAQIVLQDKNCRLENPNLVVCKVPKNSDFEVYGQKTGNYNLLSSEKFEKPGYYHIRHGTNERVFNSPMISTKDLYMEVMNSIGRKVNRSVKKTPVKRKRSLKLKTKK